MPSPKQTDTAAGAGGVVVPLRAMPQRLQMKNVSDTEAYTAFDHLFAYTSRELDDLQHAQKLQEAIERNIRLQRPDAARNAVRKLLANTDDVIRSRKGLSMFR